MKRIVWAIDFQARKEKLYLPTLNALKRFMATGEYEVEPVFVLSLAAFAAAGRERLGKLTPRNDVPRAFEEWLDTLGIEQRLPGKVLTIYSLSVGEAVQKVLKYAQSVDASFIAVGSHASKGVSRWVLGSFAENVVTLSKIPVLVSSLKSHSHTKKSPIFFASDLTADSKRALSRVAALAKKAESPLLLYHCVEMTAVADTAFPAPFVTPSAEVNKLLRENSLKKRSTLEGWAAALKKNGIKARVIFDDRAFGNVARNILERATKANAGLIAMVSKTHKGWGNILGSQTRKVLRQSAIPVWVLQR